MNNKDKIFLTWSVGLIKFQPSLRSFYTKVAPEIVSIRSLLFKLLKVLNNNKLKPNKAKLNQNKKNKRKKRQLNNQRKRRRRKPKKLLMMMKRKKKSLKRRKPILLIYWHLPHSTSMIGKDNSLQLRTQHLRRKNLNISGKTLTTRDGQSGKSCMKRIQKLKVRFSLKPITQ